MQIYKKLLKKYLDNGGRDELKKARGEQSRDRNVFPRQNETTRLAKWYAKMEYDPTDI